MWGWMSSRRSSRSQETVGTRPSRQQAASAEVDLPSLPAALPQIAAEFARARRYERPVTVAVFSVAPAQEGDHVVGTPLRPPSLAVAPVLGTVARRAMREIDIVSCDTDSGCCIVVMPEIAPEEGQRAIARLRGLCADRLGCPIFAGMAVFPLDGWTFGDLVRTARNGGADREQAADAKSA